MPIPSFTVPCLRNDIIARDVYEFTLQKPEGFHFKPGQFVLFDTPLLDNPNDRQPRAFSIASTPSEPELLFVAKMKEGGRASRWIAEALKPGTQVQLQGPFGNFLLDRETDKDYLFIATGSGIAPFRSQILHALEKGDTRKIDLVFGVRHEDDIFWKDAFEDVAKGHPNFSYQLTLTQPSDHWKEHRGRVQTLVPLIVDSFERKNMYICGSPVMTSELKKLCLEEWKIERKDLHVEGYI